MQHGDVPMVNVNLAALKPWEDSKNHRASSRFKHDGLYNGGVKLSWVNQDMPGPSAVRIINDRRSYMGEGYEHVR